MVDLRTDRISSDAGSLCGALDEDEDDDEDASNLILSVSSLGDVSCAEMKGSVCFGTGSRPFRNCPERRTSGLEHAPPDNRASLLNSSVSFSISFLSRLGKREGSGRMVSVNIKSSN
jgi:hypothetical protein